MSTELNIEIARITELTKAGIVLWERVPGLHCTYQTIDETNPRLEISCCAPKCYVEYENERVAVSCDDLSTLCNAVIEQIKWSSALTAKAVTLLRKIKPTQKGGAA